MPHRDPETGQFVPADAEDVASFAYEDFDVQHERIQFVLGSDLAGGTTTFEDFHTFEALGGLQRDELAELVALAVHVATFASPAADDEGHIRQGWELSMDGASQLVDVDEGVTTTDVDGVTGVDRNVWSLESDPDILDVAQIAYVSGFDEVDGAGMAGSENYDRSYHYREWAGLGPVVDRHTNFHVHVEHTLSGDSTRGAVFAYYQLIWDVFDRR